MKFLPLGVGDAFSEMYFSSSLVVESEGHCLLVDCPHPLRKMLRLARNGPTVSDLQGIVLTHLHADHASGLEILGFYCRFVEGRRIPLFAHPNVLKDLWDRYLAGSMEYSIEAWDVSPTRRKLEDFFDVRPITENNSTPFGPFTIRCRPTLHSLPTIALRLNAHGKELGYSGDTVFDPGLIEWLAEADLFIHECGNGYMHTEYEQLMGVQPEILERMRLIHFPDRFDQSTSKIRCLHEGDWQEV